MTEQEKVLRDRFAAAAMQALIKLNLAGHKQDLCKEAYKFADFMLITRRETGGAG
jgi:hypothetical protein